MTPPPAALRASACRHALLLPALLRMTLPDELRATLDDHVQGCLRCAGELDRMGAEAFEIQFAPHAAPPPSAAAPADDLALLGELLAPAGYFAVELMSCNAHATVCRAWDARAERWAAVKLLGLDEAADPASRRRFLVEAATLAAFPHPGIVALHETGETAGRPFFAMEHANGGTLAQWAAADGPFPAREAAAIVRDACRPLAALHRHGVVHRDLKPGNIVVARDAAQPRAGTPKLADFGIARRLDHDAPLTEHGHVHGTPQYMAPEQFRAASAATPASDVYSLGAILFELVAGAPAFAPLPCAELAAAKSAADFDFPPELRGASPSDFQALVRKCLRRDPAERYADAAQLLADLELFMAGDHLSAAPFRPSGPRAGPNAAWCAVLALLAIAGAAAAWLAADNAALRRQLDAVTHAR